jgi:UDP-N-acetylmuramoyl-L-alanyl-D-glutamate--2,6-diaminopimelate ligase
VVPGRFEAIDEGQAFDVVVDFAHTPDAIDAVIGAARAVTAPRGGRIHALISVAGNRAAELNEPIGAATARLADTVIVSKGAMRSGSDATTIEPLFAGARAAAAAPVDRVPDRREAIRAVLARAGAHDVVLILGRGARTRLGRNLAGDGPVFDDRVVARDELHALLDAGSQAGAATMRA